jgi:hypothetical protein
MIPQMTATLAVRLETLPTAADIDRLAVEFLVLEARAQPAAVFADVGHAGNPDCRLQSAS